MCVWASPDRTGSRRLRYLPLPTPITVRRLIGAAACVGVGLLAEFIHPQAVLVGLVIVAIFITVILSERSTPVRRDLVYSPGQA